MQSTTTEEKLPLGLRPDDPFSEETDLKRDLGLVEAVSVVISRIIGSGIFRTPAPIMALVGSTSLFER
jgi:basic amino acid/polyamine antiporter, APA family